MKIEDREKQEKAFEHISKQHGGYWRHEFTDHAYLYNLYFPPEEFFARLTERIRPLVLNYPVAQNELASLVGAIMGKIKQIGEKFHRIKVGSSISKGSRIIFISQI